MEMRAPRNPSSHIHSIGFDEETGTLAVKFHKGGVYHYQGVSSATYQKLHSADSAGEFFCANIKGKINPTRPRG